MITSQSTTGAAPPAPDEIDQLRKDAARYHWHRKHGTMALLCTTWAHSRRACEIGGDCDAATDAAMEDVPL